MAYRLLITDEANADLDEVFQYIANTLKNPLAATRLADQLESHWAHLAEHPYLFEQSRDPYLKQRGYRKIPIENYVLLYQVDDTAQCVIISRLFYGKRDYAKYL